MVIQIYSDGSSSAKGGKPIGWGWLVVKDGKHLAHGYGGHPSGTNNQGELNGAIDGLWYCFDHHLNDITLISDSQYVLNMADGTYFPKKNIDLVRELQMLAKCLKIKTQWVKGHTGNRGNEFVDKLANRGKRRAKKGWYG